MKKIFTCFVLFFMLISVFAAPIKITVLSSGDSKFPDGTTLFEIVGKMFKADYPDVVVEHLTVNLGDGSTLSMDALLAAGTPPNVYIDTSVRASKYMVPEFALPLQGYIRDIKKYIPSIMASYTRGKDILAIPAPFGAQGMCINLDIMKEIGFTVKWDWTIDDFLKMAELVKVKYGGKKWATGMFAANQSGDYLLHNWFEAFGAHYYINNDYDNSVIAKTGGAKTYAFYQTLMKNGYIPANSSTLNDDDYCLEWSKGNYAATAFYTGWLASYLDSAVAQKIIDKPFNYAFVPFPRGPGVKKVPTYASGALAIVHKTSDENINKIASRYVEYWGSVAAQEAVAKGLFNAPTRMDAKGAVGTHVTAINRIVVENGIYDSGLTDPRFTERRALQFPILQQLLNFKLTPEQAIAMYEKALSAVK